MSGFDYTHPVYLHAREKAKKRSNGRCQMCGHCEGEESHHWAVNYKPARETESDDLIWVCRICHTVTTLMRQAYAQGLRPLEVFWAVKKVGMESLLKISGEEDENPKLTNLRGISHRLKVKKVAHLNSEKYFPSDDDPHVLTDEIEDEDVPYFNSIFG